MQSAHDTIVRRIHAKKHGWVFSPKDLQDITNRDTVDKTLSRLVRKGTIRRLCRGLYDFPKTSQLLGVLSPSADQIANAIAKSNKAFPSGAMAANLLGLSTQVPAQTVFLTNGKTQRKTIGNQIIKMQHARLPLFDKASYQVNLVIQALAYLGKSNIDDNVVNVCSKTLDSNDINTIIKLAPSFPGWLADVTHKIYKVSSHNG